MSAHCAQASDNMEDTGEQRLWWDALATVLVSDAGETTLMGSSPLSPSHRQAGPPSENKAGGYNSLGAQRHHQVAWQVATRERAEGQPRKAILPSKYAYS